MRQSTQSIRRKGTRRNILNYNVDFTPSLEAKQFFRFTGPPENWLTAIKYMTWGLEEKHRDRWSQIQPGDIFFIHSTGAQTSRFKNAKSGVIGIGVVGTNFTVKNDYLWIEETEQKRNIWPLLVPFSEIYLFSNIPTNNLWDAPNENNKEETSKLIDKLVKGCIPMAKLPAFPKMGSFSQVSPEVSKQILYEDRPLFEYHNDYEDSIEDNRTTKLKEVKNASETLRYAETLRVFTNIESRIIKPAAGQYIRNNELLARAELVHCSILQQLIEIFRARGYETMSNRHVDLFAYNGQRSYLIEVKSTENKNFRSQARKGLIQLFEYNYFEIGKFLKEQKLSFNEQYKILTPSVIPSDGEYVTFINKLNVGVALAEPEGLKAIGNDLGFTRL